MTIEILEELLKTYSTKELANKLGVACGTLNRWKTLQKVPSQYKIDLMKIIGLPIDYSTFSYKEKDQFFTPVNTVNYCYNQFLKVISSYKEDESIYTYIEPSAGSGNFLLVLPKDRTIALDIEPKGKDIIQADYLNWLPVNKNKTYVVFGNPPFGLRGHLALQFINHSSVFADYVCFILPQLFESDGKGVARKRVVGYHLIHSEKLDSHFLSPGDKKISIACIFQIWSKHHYNPVYNLTSSTNDILKIYSLSDGGTPSTTRNKRMHNQCDIYLPSTCFGKETMTWYDSFEMLPNRRGYGIMFLKNKQENIEKFKQINWSQVAFLSTNSAYNLRTSTILNEFLNE